MTARSISTPGEPNPARPAPRRTGRSRWPSLGLGLLVAGGLLSCRTATAPDPVDSLRLQLDAVPLLLKAADTLEVATIWATVLQDGHPVEDSTLVSFAATNGTIEPEALTRDGLARAQFRPGASVGVAAIVAQVKSVRDTVLVTLY